MADFLLTVGVDTSLSFTEMQRDITSLVSRINSNPQKIKIQFDIDKAATDKLKSQLDSVYKSMSSISRGGTGLTGATSMSKVAQEARAANAQISDMASRLSVVNAALKEIQVTNNSITSTYKNIKNALGGEAATGQNAAELDIIKTKYLELQAAVERLRTAKSAATQEDINNIYQLQAELQTLMNTTQRRITAEQEAARVAKEAARAEEEAARSAAKAEAERAAQVAANERLDKQYFTTISQLENALRSYTAAENSKNASSRDAYSAIKITTDTLKTNYAAYKNGTISIDEFKRKVSEASTTLTSSTSVIKANGDATKTLSERMGGLASKFGSWLTVSQAIMYSIRAIRQMITTSIELDDAMTQMQIVTKASAAQMNEFADSAAAAAKRVGSSISDFTDSATTFARLGYSMDESSQLAEFTAMLQNVGDIEVRDAQDALTSIIKAFDIDASEIESIMDKLVTTGNNFPISVSQIAEGMTNASSSLAAAGNSFEQSVALLTAANTTIQDAAKSSTGLRTIAARIRNTKTELDDLGEVMTTASYEELVKMLTDWNVALTDVNGEYRSTYDIMADIAAQWDKMSSMEQAALATAMSGTRQQAVFYSIIEQFKEASGAMDAMADSAGALDEAYAVYMESVTFHINQFKAAFQELSADVFKSEFLNFFIDFAAGALNLVDGLFKIINALGGLKTVLVAVSGILLTIKLDSFITMFTKFGSKITGIGGSLLSFVGKMRELPAAMRIARSEGQGLSAAFDLVGISASTAQIAIGALTAVLTIAIAAYSNYRRNLEATRQAQLDAAKESAQEADNIMDLYAAYKQADAAYKSNEGSKENLEDATRTLLSALGYEEAAIDDLIGKYAELDTEINKVTGDMLNRAVNDALEGFSAAYGNLQDAFGNGSDLWANVKKFFSGDTEMLSWMEDTQEFGTKIGKILEDAGLISSGNYNQGGAITLDIDNPDEIIASYEKLLQMRETLQNAVKDGTLTTDEYSGSGLVSALDSEIGRFEEVLSDYLDSRDLLNESLAKSQVFNEIQANGVPETIDELNALKQELIDTAVAGETFKGSADDIEAAFDSAFSELGNAIPDLGALLTADIDDAADVIIDKAQAIRDAFTPNGNESITGFTAEDEINKFNEWVDSLNENDLDLVYQISLDSKSATYTLDEWKSALDDAQFHFDDLMADDGDNSFSAKVDSYISNIKELQSALDDLSNGDFDNSDFVELVEKYPELAKNSDNLTDAIRAQIKELTGYEKVVDSTGATVSDATGIMAVFEDAFGRVDSDEDVAALEAFMNAVLELGEVVGSTAFSIDIEAETKGMENLWTAMKESVSSTGLTAESISNLKARYQDLENYDAARLFEKTANGVHLNTTALRELESAYEAQKKTKIDSTLEDLVSQYNALTDEINKADNAASTADLYARRADIQAQIDDTAMLAAQYEGLTSAFYKWEQAQSIGEEGDMYDSLAGGLENIKELYDQGLIGTNKFRTAVQLMSNEDLSNASIDELLAAYESGYEKMTRYFQDSSDGCLNFLNDVQELNSEWVHLNEDGSWDINFGLGNDQEIADALGMNVESVQAILRKLSDYGFEINLDSVYSAFDLMSSKAEEANDKLKELGKTDYTFNFGTQDLDYVTEQIDEAKKLLDTFRDTDGNIDFNLDGAEEAQTILVSLLSTKQALTAPEIMQIDTSALASVDESLAGAVASMQEFIQLSNDLAIQTELGVDTSDTLTKIQSVASELDSIPDDVKTKLGIDSEEFNTALQSITETEIDINAGVTISEDDIATVQASIDGITGKDIELLTNSSVVMGELQGIDNYNIANKSFSVNISNNPLSTLATINSYRIADKSYTITAKTVNTTAQAAGTAHATGTAMATGNWGTTNSGIALGGEEKQELVVRDGKFFTIGDKSAEFFRYKKGDIIFNGDQTEQIFKYGKIRTGSKRGTSFAQGTAFSSGSGKITGSGSVITKPSGGGSSSSGKSGGSSSSSNDKDDSEVIDWIEIAIDRIERAINRLATIATSEFKTLGQRLKATNDELSEVAYELTVQQAGYDRYIKQANSVGLSADLAEKVRNGTIDIVEYDGDTAELIKEYQEWYEKALDCKDAIDELNESIAELYQNKFNDIATDYENQLSLLEHLTNTYNNGIADLEERGYLASTEYYAALQKVEKQNIAIQKKELADLTRAMSEAINSGYIEEGSEAWYEFQQNINAVKEAIQESETAVIEFANAIREVKWAHFDYLQEQISAITEEADFLIDLLDYSDLYTDNGQLTDTGMATMGLHGQNYNVYMAQADKYAEELKKLNAEIADDPNNTKLLERREELLKAQRESILAAEDEKQAIVDMVREGIELELSALQELITSYANALDSAKSLYDYQKKIKDQTSEIAKLQKQLAAYSGDTSEEARATKQRIEVDLANAMESLEETQYENYISEQKKLLDNLYDEYEMVLNQRLDDIDALISDMIDNINANAATISDTIALETKNVGYDISEAMKEIWSNEGGAYAIMTKYGESFSSALTSINNVLNGISVKVEQMVAASEAAAKSTTSTETSSTKTDTTVKPQTSKGDTPSSSPSSSSSSSSSPSSSSTKSLTEKDYYGVALAIWNGNYGWGTGSTRTSRLKAKGFDANKVQSIVNKMGSDGYIRSGAWVGKYYGITSLAPYHYNKYLHGGLVDYTGLAQLDGSPSEPEAVLDAKDTANFIALKDAMRSIANGDSPLAALFGGGEASGRILEELAKIDAPLGAQATNIGDITYEVNIPIDHVADYEDFMNQMRKDGKFEKLLQSMTVDRLVGKSKISKNRYQW